MHQQNLCQGWSVRALRVSQSAERLHACCRLHHGDWEVRQPLTSYNPNYVQGNDKPTTL